MRPIVHALAPAKVNLALSVGPPNASGMHPISSWMVTVDLHDEMTVQALDANARSLYAIVWHADAKRQSKIDWSITKDLAVRAHQLLEAHVGRQLPLKMHLQKRIPVGGGLGGGSSNAAAMLRAVNELFELNLCVEELVALAVKLGSDVPFLVRGGSAIVEGIGERLHAAPMPADLHAVLVLPDAVCATNRVYQAFDALRPDAALRSAQVHALAQSLSTLQFHQPFNDLTEAAFAVAPRLRGECEEISELIQREVHVSGSGSTLYFLCASAVESDLLADAVARHMHIPCVPVQAVTTTAAVRLAHKNA